jgi:hypothetical protein
MTGGESPLLLARRGIERLRRRTLELYLSLARDEELETFTGRAEALAERAPRVLDAIQAAEASALFEPGEAAATRAHLARVLSDAKLAPVRVALRRAPAAKIEVDSRALPASEALERFLKTGFEPVATAMIGRLASVVEEMTEARAAANEAARPVLSGAKLEEIASDRAAMVTAAERFFEHTDAMAIAARELLAPEARNVFELFRSLATADRKSARRMSAIGTELAPLGFERDLAERVRIETRASFDFDTRPRVVPLDPPRDIRIVVSTIPLGIASELYEAEAVGRALAGAMASVALPYALRSPPIGSVARTIGTSIATLASDQAFLRRARDLGSKTAEASARRAGAVLVLDTRLQVAAFLARDARSDPEAASDRVSRAVAVSVPPPLAALAVATPAALGPRMMGRLTGLALSAAMRERYDEDWFRNPRAAEPLRAGAERAGTLSAEAWLAEIGGSLDSARLRIAELFG